MASRFTDTEKWQDGWFSDLKPYEKLLFNYLCDNCDCAGFMEVSKRKIANDIGFSVQDCEGAFKGLSRGLEWASDGYVLFVKNFLKRQKNLPVNPKNSQHKGIIKRFILYRNKFDLQAITKILNQDISIIIETFLKPLPSPLEGAKVKVKVKDKDKDKDKLGDIEGGSGEEKEPIEPPMFAVPDEVSIDPDTEYRVTISGMKIQSVDDFVHRNFPMLCEELKMKLGLKEFYEKFLAFESRILDAKYFNDTEFRKHFSNYMHKEIPRKDSQPATKTEQVFSGMEILRRKREEEDRLEEINKQAS